jgi:hypothetical protein
VPAWLAELLAEEAADRRVSRSGLVGQTLLAAVEE